MNKKTNMDPEEITKFDALAKSWWDPKGPMKPLHQLNPLRLQFIEKHTALLQQHACDVGCGAGILSESLARAKAHVVGLDPSDAVIQVAIVHANTQQLKIDYRCECVEEFATSHPNQFDLLTCMEMLEHVPDPAQMIQVCADLVKPGGKLFFSTINRNVKSFLQAIVGAEYILQLLPKGTHHYRKFIRPSELDRWARASKLQLIELTGIHYHVLNHTFSLTSDVSVNYLACYTKTHD